MWHCRGGVPPRWGVRERDMQNHNKETRGELPEPAEAPKRETEGAPQTEADPKATARRAPPPAPTQNSRPDPGALPAFMPPLYSINWIEKNAEERALSVLLYLIVARRALTAEP